MPGEGAGIRFGQYVLLRRIARGGMAEVFLAQQRGLEGFDRRVAVKRILPHLSDAPDFIKMFLGEAKLAAQLTHPNIVHIYDFGKVESDYFIAMEYVEGVHAGMIFRHGADGDPMPPTMVARLGADAAAALHYAHELRGPNGKRVGLVHRDVSPANVMVSFDGVVKLCDFGIAKAAALSDQLTNPGTVKGKYAYMSPEQTTGSPLDGRSDVFALSIILWELLTAQHIVPRGDAVEAMRMIRDGKLQPLDRVAPHTPPQLARAVMWGLQNKRENRPTAMELAHELESFVKSSPELATPMLLGNWLRTRFPREASQEAHSPGTEAAPGTQAGPEATEASVVDPRIVPIHGLADTTGETVALPAPTRPRAPSGVGLSGQHPFGPPEALQAPPVLARPQSQPPHPYPSPSQPPQNPFSPPSRPPTNQPYASPSQPPTNQPYAPGGQPPTNQPYASPSQPPQNQPYPPSGQPRAASPSQPPPFAMPPAPPPHVATLPYPPPSPAAGAQTVIASPGAEGPTVIGPPPVAQAQTVIAPADALHGGQGPTLFAPGAGAVGQPPAMPSTRPGHPGSGPHGQPGSGPHGQMPPGAQAISLPRGAGGQSTLYVDPATMAARARAGVAAASGQPGRGTLWMQPRSRVALAIGGLVALALVSFVIALAARKKPRAVIAPADAGVVRDAAIDAPANLPAPVDAPPPTIPADAAPTTADLEVRTRPDGATIKIAGDSHGQSPTTLSLAPGRYFIDAELEGWMPERRAIELEAGQRVVQDIVFNTRLTHNRAQTGRLIVRTTPPCEVLLGTRRLADAPFDMAFDPGTYTLQLKHARHATLVRRVTIAAGKTTKLIVTLP